MAKLDLPQSPRAAVYRYIEGIIRSDQLLSAFIKPHSFRAWDGSSRDSDDFAFVQTPALRFTPANGPEDWVYPHAQRGDLFINCEMLIQGYDYDDVFNLWWAVQRAIYPRDRAQVLAFQGDLARLSGGDGCVVFSQPAHDPTPKDKSFWAIGQMRILIIETLMP